VGRADRVTLSAEEWVRLRDWIADRTTPPRVRRRAEIVRARAEGASVRSIAETLQIDPGTVSLWIRRFQTLRLEGGLRDSPRPGRLGPQTSRTTERVLHATYHAPPPRGLRWTTRSLGRYLGVNHMVVHRAWRSRGVSFTNATGGTDRLPHPRPTPCVDLLGVVIRWQVRAVVFGIQPTAGSSLLRFPLAELPISESLSGGYLVRPDPLYLDELMGVLNRVQIAAAESPRGRPEVRDLLILLRELEEATPASTQLHVITERWPAAQELQLERWLSGRPRVFLQKVASHADWPGRVRAFVNQWEPSALRRGSFSAVPSFALAGIRFAGNAASSNQGLVWSVRHGEPVEPTPGPKAWTSGPTDEPTSF
jgi:transposase